MTPEIALQMALRTRLVSTAAVTALVPAAAILDRNELPAPDPSIILGEGQHDGEVDAAIERRFGEQYVGPARERADQRRERLRIERFGDRARGTCFAFAARAKHASAIDADRWRAQ